MKLIRWEMYTREYTINKIDKQGFSIALRIYCEMSYHTFIHLIVRLIFTLQTGKKQTRDIFRKIRPEF
jgi:hypothetical protein